MANDGMVPGILAEPGSAAAGAGRAAQRHRGNSRRPGGRRRGGRHRAATAPGTAATTGTAAAATAPAPRRHDEHRPRAHGDPAARSHPRSTTAPARRRRRRASSCSSSSGASGSSSPSSSSPSAIGATKAAWLGVVKAPALKRAAVTQQEADIEIPAQRGSITDVNGIDLAVSEPASDIAATPYLIDDATKVAAQLSPLIGVPEDELLRKLASRDDLRLPRARGAGREVRPRRQAQDRGHRVHPALQARLSARLVGLAAARQHGHRRAGPRRARVLLRQAAARAPTASAGWSRTRWATRSRCATPSRSSPATTSA